MPQIITQGVKYIKINKTDLNGVDMDSNLNSLQKLRLIYNDIGVVEYNVINITEYPDYYLYLTSANNNITSTDNEILDYSLSTNNLSTTSQLNNISPYGDIIINYGVVTQALGYFQTYAQGSQYGGGAFTVGKAANTGISIICNYVVGFLSPGDFAFIFLVSNIRGVLTSATLTQGNSVGFISHSLPNLYDNEVIRVALSPSLGGSGTLTNLTLSITPTTSAQSVSPTTTVIEPILPPNFYNSSCNAIINNVTNNQFSLNYQKVDYPYVSIIAQNTQAIINNTAVKAQVQDSNYNSLFYINPRYNGSRLIADKLNEYTLGDISYGKTAVIEQNQKYFGYFDWVGSMEPELKDTSLTHIIYLIDAEGNTINNRDSQNQSVYYDFVYNFERDKNQIININTPQGNPQIDSLNGSKKLLYSGLNVIPILHSDGGINYPASASSTIKFTNTLANPPVSTGQIPIASTLLTGFDVATNRNYIRFPYSTFELIFGIPWTLGGVIISNILSNTPSSPYFGRNNFIQTNPGSSNTNYNEITEPFIVKVGDQIRWNYNEDDVSTVTEIELVSIGFNGEVRAYIDKLPSTLPITSDILVRRFVKSPSSLIFDYAKPSGSGADGFVYPSAMSDELENNIDKIQEKLKRDNII